MLQNWKRFASLLCMYPKFTTSWLSMLFHDETHVFIVVKQNTYVNDNVCSYGHILVCIVLLHCLPAELLSALPKNIVVSLSPISMKSTKVHILGEMCMHGTANWWVGPRACVYSRGLHASSWRRVWHGLATQVDSVRESTLALSCDFLSLQGINTEQEIMHIGFFACFHGISLKHRCFRKITVLIFRLT